MDFFEAAAQRRSVRKFSEEDVPDEVVRKALETALIAANSSNLQTWNFYWVKDPVKKARLVELCMSQAAARGAKHLIVIVADPREWRRAHQPLLDFAESVKAPSPVMAYYKKLIPLVYSWGFLNTLGIAKWLIASVYGLFKPIQRGPNTLRDLQEVAIKSAALASENFVLALSAQGYASCMMEGFDECRVKHLVGAGRTARVVMVVAVGKEGPRGVWGPRFRIDSAQVVKVV
jgi:nitroreductase